jgi:hypothetical protein
MNDQERCRRDERPVSLLAGGRLAFTNVAHVSAFESVDARVPQIALPFVTVRDREVELARAAALNANFPPVFPNARIDIMDPATETGCGRRSYYVTDGGAMENLGLLSALLALRSTFSAPDASGPLRDIDLVLAEASYVDYDYSQDRGLNAATGQARERLAGGLTLELLEDVTALARRLDPDVSIRVHDLSLPLLFRSRGGFGTHWMFPQTVRIANPLLERQPLAWRRIYEQYAGVERHWASLDRDQLMRLWRSLYRTDRNVCDSANGEADEEVAVVIQWMCGRNAGGEAVSAPDRQLAAWQGLQQAAARSSTP